MRKIRKAVLKFVRVLRKPLAIRLLILLVITSLVLYASNVIMGQLTSVTLIGSQGTVKVSGVGVYWDSNCTQVASSVEWGTVEPGSAKNVTMHIRNEGNEPTSLFLIASNWVPSNASDYMELKWDYDGRTLEVGEIVQVTLILTVFPSIEGIADFSFDIIISSSS